MRTVAFCEVEPYCRAVISRHWPGVPILGDIREVTADTVRDALRLEPGWRDGSGGSSATEPTDVELICGGFPCQDISVAGKGAGLAGSRSGLWSEYARLIGELRPRYVIVENVSALLSRGLEQVLGDLASFGFDAEWHCIPASYVGAPHRRDRVWIVAYAQSAGWRPQSPGRNHTHRGDAGREETAGRPSAMGQVVADASISRCGQGSAHAGGIRQGAGAPGQPQDNAEDCARVRRLEPSWSWGSEPDVGRVAHGVPSRVDRLRALGNAVVPQVVEVIGRAIMRFDHEQQV